MLTCIYHPIDGMQVVNEDDADRLLASGVWFDSPVKAKAYREKVEQEIKSDKLPKPKMGRPKLEQIQ
jgi:hypothetical protein